MDGTTQPGAVDGAQLPDLEPARPSRAFAVMGLAGSMAATLAGLALCVAFWAWALTSIGSGVANAADAWRSPPRPTSQTPRRPPSPLAAQARHIHILLVRPA